MRNRFHSLNGLLFNDKGFAFIAVITLSWLLIALSLSYFDVTISEMRFSRSSENSLKAEAVAEAGVEETLWEYNYGGMDFLSSEGWSGSGTKTKTVDPYTDASGNTVGSYTISVANWNTSSPLVTVTGGLAGGTVGTGTQAVVKTMLKPRPVFSSAVKTKSEIEFSGNAYTDSYNSALGAYGGSNIYQNGDVVTNGADTSAIELSGNALIKGDAATGSGGTISDPSKVTGTVYDSANETISNNTVPPLLVALPSMGSLNIPMILLSGLYKYTDIDLSGNAVVIVNGSVSIYLTGSDTSFKTTGNAQVTILAGGNLTLYVDGDIKISGNGIVNGNGTLSPTTLQIYGTPSAGEAEISGNGAFVGVLSMPQAEVEISGNGGLYGAIIADEFEGSGNAAIHYDEQLSTNGPSDGLKLRWYRRV